MGWTIPPLREIRVRECLRICEDNSIHSGSPSGARFEVADSTSAEPTALLLFLRKFPVALAHARGRTRLLCDFSFRKKPPFIPCLPNSRFTCQLSDCRPFGPSGVSIDTPRSSGADPESGRRISSCRRHRELLDRHGYQRHRLAVQQSKVDSPSPFSAAKPSLTRCLV